MGLARRATALEGRQGGVRRGGGEGHHAGAARSNASVHGGAHTRWRRASSSLSRRSPRVVCRELELVMADRDLGRRNLRWAPRQWSTRGEKAVAGEGEEAAAGAGERAVTGDCERRKRRGEQ